MARKRKADSKSTEAQHKKQQLEERQQLQRVKEEQVVDDQEVLEEEEEYEEVEVEEEEEEEEEGEEEDDEEDGSADDEDEEDQEPFQKLLEPLGKEQLINLLCEAANKHRDVADRLRKVADEDPAHRKIFVHGLGWDSNAETLTSVFKVYGEIEDCKAVCDKISGKSKGYGFVLFKTRSGARRALEQPQKKIGNRMTACQLAAMGPVPSSATAAGATAAPVLVPAQPVSEYTQRKIYVSNVAAELDPQKLLAFFSKYGEIEEGPLGLDKQTGKPRGFCLFVYRRIESAKKALEEPHKNLEGHTLHCQRAIDGPKPNKLKANKSKFQRNDNSSFVGSAAGPGHLMAPAASAIQFDQGAAAQALNPVLGQALTALLATQGANLGLTNLLGALGGTGVGAPVNPVMPGAGHGGYGNQSVGSNVSSGVMGSYGNQVGYQNQQFGQGGSGRLQHGAGHLGGIRPYMGQ